MPKDFKPRMHHATAAPYERPNKHQKSNSRKSNDDGKCTSRLQSSASQNDHILSAYSKVLRSADDSVKTPSRAALAESPMSGKLVTLGRVTDKIGDLEATTQILCGIREPASPRSSEPSTIVDQFDDSIFAGTPSDARLEEFEFELENVVQIDNDRCKVRWADSIIRNSDLCKRYLHGRPLAEYMASSAPVGDGLSKVIWLPTWEPVDILRGYEDVVKRESMFEFGDVIKEQDGYSLVQWESSVVHESTVETMDGHPLLNEVQSVSYPFAHEYSVITWEPMWVPTHIMEPCGDAN